ncbi:hypothetical protein BJX76DRAFT_365123 [Aspergillus varians]
MSPHNLLHHCLGKAQALFSYIQAKLQVYLSHPLILKSLGLIATIHLLRSINSYLSRNAQNNWVRTQPWNPSNEIILLTGGSSGIGKQIMQDLVKLDVKAIIVFDIHEPGFELPKNVTFHKVDVTSPTSIKTTASLIRKTHGPPTILINNAGVSFANSILDEPEEQIRLTFEVNVLAHFWAVREFLPSMLRSNHGHVVTMASMAGFAAVGGLADYSASKAAVVGFHEGLTQEVRHCIIHPLYVQTPMTSVLVENRERFGQPIMTAEKVSQAVVRQLVNGDGGQVVVPASHGAVALLRGLPGWLQEELRDYSSRAFVRLRELERGI